MVYEYDPLARENEYDVPVIAPVPGSTGTRYVISQSSGNVTVSGNNLSENLSYSTQYYLTTNVSPAGTGTVSQSSSWFSAGSSVTLTAQAYSGPTHSKSCWIVCSRVASQWYILSFSQKRACPLVRAGM